MFIAVVVVVCIALYAQYLRRQYAQNATLPPAIGIYLPWIGCAPSFAINPSQFLANLNKTHGEPLFYRSLDFYAALKTVQVEEVLGQVALEFKAEDMMRVMRKRLSPRFQDMASLIEDEMRYALSLEALHRHEKVHDIFPVFMRVLLCMNSMLLVGKRLSRHHVFQKLFYDMYWAAKMVISRPGILGYFHKRKTDQIRAQILDLIKDEISFLRSDTSWLDNEEDNNQSFLQDLMRSFGNDAEWTDDHFAAKLFGMLYATAANTPMVATNTLLFVLLDGEVREKVQEEVIKAFRIGGGRLSSAAINTMTLLGWSIEESLRHLPIPVQIRLTTAPTPIPGTDYIIPADRAVAIVPAVFHNDPVVFPDPERFKPDRFKEKEVAELKRTGSSHFITPIVVKAIQTRRRSTPQEPKILSWGKGTHKCLGQELAYLEIRMLLGYLLQNYRVNLDRDNMPNTDIDYLTTGVSMFTNRSVLLKNKEDLSLSKMAFRQHVIRRHASEIPEDMVLVKHGSSEDLLEKSPKRRLRRISTNRS